VILIFNGLTARRLYKSLGVKELSVTRDIGGFFSELYHLKENNAKSFGILRHKKGNS
jgi:hypothetical protein